MESEPVGRKRKRAQIGALEDNASATSDPGDDGILLRQNTSHSEEEQESPSDGFASEEDDGEDLQETMERDYRTIDELDRYDNTLLDQQEYSPLDSDRRFDADQAIDLQYKRRADPLGRLADTFVDDDNEERGTEHRVRQRYASYVDHSEAEEDDDAVINLENFDVPLREWIASERPRNEIKRRFRQFLLQYKDRGEQSVHFELIHQMAQRNLQSLEINYIHLSQAAPILAIWLADAPREMFEIFDEVAMEAVLSIFPAYGDIHDEVHIRIVDLPIHDNLRDLRQIHLNALVKVSGVVTRRTSVFPQLKMVKFDCARCGASIGPYRQSSSEIKITTCPECEGSGPFLINSESTVYRNYQKLMLQEAPGSVLPGRVPRHKEVILVGDLIDRARPGEEVEVTGIYMHSYDAALNIRQGFPVFSTVIEANCIRKLVDDSSTVLLSEDDKRKILSLAKDPDIGQKIIRSIAPSIYGHMHIKEAVTLAMFGGQRKDVRKKHKVRGDINVLLLGDPGTAKSQILKYVEKTAPRAVYTTGKGASAVGLTAAVHKDPLTREWTLEGGALVLADRGVCLIDEFDKMNEGDRTSIHEAMEQQSISISKAGIVTTLQARCAVIAAANPIGGRYDPSKTLTENVELTDPIIQRFDVLCVLQDEINADADEKLARFVVGSHVRSHPDTSSTTSSNEDQGSSIDHNKSKNDLSSVITQPMLRKYIIYARANVHPSLQYINRDKVASLYTELRRESMISGAIPIGVRHVETIMRLSEAHAKLHLRDYVRDDDVSIAIRIMVRSFVDAQKFSIRRQMERKFFKYINYNRDHNELLLHILRKLFKEAQRYSQAFRKYTTESVQIPLQELEARAHELQIFNLSDFYASGVFLSSFILDDNKGFIRQIYE